MVYTITPALWKQIVHYSGFPQTGVSLRQMVMFGQNPSQGTLLRASQFLAEELPIRLAHRVKELDALPNNLNNMPSIEKVKKWYAESFEELVNFPKPELSSDLQEALMKTTNQPSLPESVPNPSLPEHMKPNFEKTNGKYRSSIQHRYYSNPDTSIKWPPEVHDYNERFTKLLSNIKRRHDPVVTTIAQGILEFKKASKSSQIDRSIQKFLDRFYMSRIGIRVLIGQHIALNRLEPHPDYVGIICTRTNIHQIAKEAIDNATFICEEHYGLFKAPPVQLICPRDLTFMYIPSHLNHMLFEVLKNSLRAVVEKYGTDADNYPPVKVIVAEGNEDITIKISDEGGGIPRSAVPLVWTFMYTTAHPENLDQDFQGTDFKAPMAGFGYGLPIARLYAQYLGGGLKLISMEGYGTDVYLHLSRLSATAEPLQLAVQRSQCFSKLASPTSPSALPDIHDGRLEERQLIGSLYSLATSYIGSQLSNMEAQPTGGPGNGNGNGNGNGRGNGGSQATSTSSSSSTSSTTSSSTSSTTSSTSSSTSSSSSSSSSSSTSSSSSSSPSPESTQVITTAVVTPTTVVVVGTSTITSTLAPSTISTPTLVAATQASRNSSSGLSSGAKAGIIAGSVVGGLALLGLLLGLCFFCRRRRSTRKAEDEAIRWPEIASSAEDRAALYPEPIHHTGRAGVGADEMEEVAGAGALGAAGGAYAASRYPSTVSRPEPTLPRVPDSVYDSEYPSSPSNYGHANRAYSPPPTNANYMNGPIAPGPAAIDYQRTTPSPPRTYINGGDSSDGGHHGALPLPGSSAEDGGSGNSGDPMIERPLSPREIPYAGGGYDQEAANGGGWRLSVVNDDPRDPYYANRY